jgi:flagellar basal body P-ring protein FlgI
MPAPIMRLADHYLRNPHTFTMARKEMTVATVEQRYYLINEADRLAALTRLFEVEPIVSALVFARTRVGIDNRSTVLIGDRVKLREVRISEGQVEVDVVEHDPNDAMCCPTVEATRVWGYDGRRLLEAPRY